MIPYLLAIAGGYLIGSTQEKELFAKGGKTKGSFWKEINESSVDYELGKYNDEDILSGQIWIKFSKLPKDISPKHGWDNIPYEIQRIINDIVYVYPDPFADKNGSIRLGTGSWGSLYLEINNVSAKDLSETLLRLSEEADLSIKENGYKGYGQIGFDNYGKYIDLEVVKT